MSRAQIQLGETIFVTIIIVVLIVFGISFFSRAQVDETVRQQDFLENLDAIVMSKYLTSIAELQCSTLQVQEANCFDIYKLEGFLTFKKQHPDLFDQYYFTQLGNAKLTIKQLYPTDHHREWVLYQNELEQPPRRVTTNLLPVSLYDPIFNKHAFGLVTLETYYR